MNNILKLNQILFDSSYSLQTFITTVLYAIILLKYKYAIYFLKLCNYFIILMDLVKHKILLITVGGLARTLYNYFLQNYYDVNNFVAYNSAFRKT